MPFEDGIADNVRRQCMQADVAVAIDALRPKSFVNDHQTDAVQYRTRQRRKQDIMCGDNHLSSLARDALSLVGAAGEERAMRACGCPADRLIDISAHSVGIVDRLGIAAHRVGLAGLRIDAVRIVRITSPPDLHLNAGREYALEGFR